MRLTNVPNSKEAHFERLWPVEVPSLRRLHSELAYDICGLPLGTNHILTAKRPFSQSFRQISHRRLGSSPKGAWQGQPYRNTRTLNPLDQMRPLLLGTTDAKELAAAPISGTRMVHVHLTTEGRRGLNKAGHAQIT